MTDWRYALPDNQRHGGGVSSIMNMTMVCYPLYKISSRGIWNNPDARHLTDYSVPNLAIQMCLIFVVTQIIQFFLKPFRQPKIVSQILGGVILGPSFLGRDMILSRKVFPIKSVIPLGNLATFGFILFQFLIGVKMDPRMVLTTGRKAMAIGFLALILPLLLTITTITILSRALHLNSTTSHMLVFVVGTQAMTSFPVIACLLTELKILNSELGRLALSSALVSDLCFTLLNMMSTNWKIGDGHSILTSLYAILACLAFVIFIVFIVRPAFIWVIRQTPQGEPVKEIYIIFILLAVLVSAIISVILGQHVFLGPFILGLAVPEGPPLGLTLENRLDSISSGLLVPIFLTTSGLRTNINGMDGVSLKVCACIIVLSLIGKMVGTMLPALYCRMPSRDAFSLAVIMSAKGIVEMATYNALYDNKIVSQPTFALMVISVIVTAGIASPLVGALYDPSRKYAGYIKRTIQHNRRNVELRILACINEQDNVPAIIKLLEASNPTRESPVYVYVLHLVELVGRAAPLLISHQMWKMNSSKPSSSEPIINSFRYYDQQNHGAVSVEAYTAISPSETMHEDICTLALDKRTSLIIIPFHKQWAIDGTISATKSYLRTLNCNVLDKAPCSVAVLVDRGQLRGSTTTKVMEQSSYRVAVVFLGGADDREALAYAKRMALESSIDLKVVRLIASNKTSINEWQRMLDEEAVKNFKESCESNGRVVYKEEMVRDGEQTAAIIRFLEQDEHDLIMVGRQYGVYSPLTAGLTEWSEWPELGVIGDMLASSDFKCGVSVLVVQQQTMAK